MSLKIRLLGAVDAELDGLRVDLRGPRQSRLLALLALHPGEGVSTNTIIDAIWDGGELPAEPREGLHTTCRVCVDRWETLARSRPLAERTRLRSSRTRSTCSDSNRRRRCPPDGRP